MKQQGFTLLELLIVIAILAILTTAVVLVLNPAEYLAEARDSQRISDLNTLRNAINLYIASVSSLSMTCAATPICTAGTTLPGGSSACTTNSSTAIDSNGWVPINFSALPAGSPISKEPIDPSNTATYHYAYKCDSTANTFELNARMESDKYGPGGDGDLGANTADGGNATSTYEIGSSLTLMGT